jgi:hypothetical protein
MRAHLFASIASLAGLSLCASVAFAQAPQANPPKKVTQLKAVSSGKAAAPATQEKADRTEKAIEVQSQTQKKIGETSKSLTGNLK